MKPAFLPSLSFLPGRTLDPRLSLFSFLSISTTWSLGPSLPRAAQVSFGSITTWCPRGSWDTCHVCPHPGLSAITRWNRLLKIERICHLGLQSRRGSKYYFSGKFASFNFSFFYASAFDYFKTENDFSLLKIPIDFFCR